MWGIIVFTPSIGTLFPLQREKHVHSHRVHSNGSELGTLWIKRSNVVVAVWTWHWQMSGTSFEKQADSSEQKTGGWGEHFNWEVILSDNADKHHLTLKPEPPLASTSGFDKHGKKLCSVSWLSSKRKPLFKRQTGRSPTVNVSLAASTTRGNWMRREWEGHLDRSVVVLLASDVIQTDSGR